MILEIKFRAYSEYYNRMFLWDELLEYSIDDVFTQDKNNDWYGTLMQFTGLKDKNGIEIYEGDIAQYYNRSGIIIYDAKRAAFCIFTEKDDIYVQLLNTVVVDIEVIGNRYSNPELLKQ